MKNCSSCKYKKSYFSELSVPTDKSGYEMVERGFSSSGDFYVKCDKGNTDEIVDFYKKCKNLNHEQSKVIVLPCHEDTDNVKHLDSMIDIVSKMKDLLDNNNK